MTERVTTLSTFSQRGMARGADAATSSARWRCYNASTGGCLAADAA